MIMISSKAGQRLAKAKAALEKWRHTGEAGGAHPSRLKDEFGHASTALAEELIADRHHLAEGD
jgi:hypothetical protein